MFTSSALRSPSACITAPWCWSSTSAVTSSIGSLALAVDLVEDDARLRHRELVAFAAHVLEQDRQVQLAAAHHLEDAVLVGVAAPCSATLRLQLAVEPVADLPAGDELAFAAGERRVVDAEVHRQRRLVDLAASAAASGPRGSVSVTPMPMPSMPLISTMSPGPASVACCALEALELQHLVDARLDRRAVGAAEYSATSCIGLSVPWLMRPMPIRPDVGRVVERADLQLQRIVGLALVRRHVLEDRVEERRQVGAGLALGAASPSRSGPTRRSPGSRAAPRSRRACRTDRRWR